MVKEIFQYIVRRESYRIYRNYSELIHGIIWKIAKYIFLFILYWILSDYTISYFTENLTDETYIIIFTLLMIFCFNFFRLVSQIITLSTEIIKPIYVERVVWVKDRRFRTGRREDGIERVIDGYKPVIGNELERIKFSLQIGIFFRSLLFLVIVILFWMY